MSRNISGSLEDFLDDWYLCGWVDVHARAELLPAIVSCLLGDDIQIVALTRLFSQRFVILTTHL